MTIPSSKEDPETQLRSKLMRRLAVAGVMILVLLGVLAMLDFLATPEENDSPVFTRPVPVPPKKEITQPVTPAPPPEVPAVSEVSASPPAAATAADVDAPVEPPPKPEVSAQPVLVETPGETRGTAVKAAPSAVPGKTTERKTAPPVVPEGTAAPVSRPVESTALPRQNVESERPLPKPPLASPPPLARLLRGYVVQAGVFANARSAEELHARLVLNGIPSTLEARVQVGPFKTKAEAEAAREKMKALGIEGLLIPPPARRK